MNDNFPDGRIAVDDQGELRIAVGVRDDTGTVIIDFFRPVVWIGMTRKQALEFAELIKFHADGISSLR